MLVLSFQDINVAKKLNTGKYRPLLSKSDFAYSSVEFSLGYSKIMNLLMRKDESLLEGDSCMWGWVYAPSEEMTQALIERNKVAIYLEVDESKVVFSNYYKYSEFVLGESDDTDFIIKNKEKAEKEGVCIQCSFTVNAIQEIKAIFTCETFMLYKNIYRCLYYQRISTQVIQSKPKLSAKVKVIINSVRLMGIANDINLINKLMNTIQENTVLNSC